MNSTIDQLEEVAASLLDRNLHADARKIYARIVELDPGNADAWLMLGAIDGECGAVDRAIGFCRRALGIQPDNVDANFILARLLIARGGLDDAADCLDRVTKQDPEHGEAWSALSGIFMQRQVFSEAVRCGRQAVRLLPGQVEVYVALCAALTAENQLSEALEVAQKATALDPRNVVSWRALARVHEHRGAWREAAEVYHRCVTIDPSSWEVWLDLGRALQNAGDLPSAERALQQALDRNPTSAETLRHLGNVYSGQKRGDAALSSFRQALQLNPNAPEIWTDFGNLQQELRDYDEAKNCYDRAIALAPCNPEAHFNLGVLWQRLGDMDLALSSFKKAIDSRPEFVEAHWYTAFILLSRGEFERGWDEYEWRLRQKEYVPRPIRQPIWDGSSLDGRRVLVHDEQGYGDTFQFVRFLPFVAARGGEVVFECHRGLGTILRGCRGCDQLIERDAADAVPRVPFDTHIHLMSLPAVLGIGGRIPAEIPYIRPDPGLVQSWRERLAADRRFKVGICWAGSANHTNELNRACSLADFYPLSQLPDVSLYSLQLGPGSEQAFNPPDGMYITEFTKEMDRAARFVDTAALMQNLDLIISIDTSIVHLAGALGRPVWTLLCATPDWRWLQGRRDSPWYPTMRIFRQKEPGNWSDVFAEVADALFRHI